MSLILDFLAILFLLATVVPLIRHDKWWVRILDFPRLQVAFFSAVVAGALVYQWRVDEIWGAGLTAALLAATAYQGYKMFPFTPLARKQVLATKPGGDKSRILTLLASNVLVSNRQSERLVGLVRDRDPDVILALEVDDWWERELRILEPDYPSTVKLPKDDTYGMALYSRFPLNDVEVKYLREHHIPSIHAWLELPCGVRVRLHCLHPAPPYPKYAEETTDRDAALFLIGKEVRQMEQPTIVMGDLNDVAWSHTTDLFQKTSGLLDPRIGRGAYNTFHARIPVFRCPVDHVFVSSEFLLVQLERLPNIGSDHFPILASFQYSSSAKELHEEPQASGDEAKEVEEKIAS